MSKAATPAPKAKAATPAPKAKAATPAPKAKAATPAPKAKAPSTIVFALPEGLDEGALDQLFETALSLGDQGAIAQLVELGLKPWGRSRAGHSFPSYPGRAASRQYFQIALELLRLTPKSKLAIAMGELPEFEEPSAKARASDTSPRGQIPRGYLPWIALEGELPEARLMVGDRSGHGALLDHLASAVPSLAQGRASPLARMLQEVCEEAWEDHGRQPGSPQKVGARTLSLVQRLLDLGASPRGLPGATRPPISFLMREHLLPAAEALLSAGAELPQAHRLGRDHRGVFNPNEERRLLTWHASVGRRLEARGLARDLDQATAAAQKKSTRGTRL